MSEDKMRERETKWVQVDKDMFEHENVFTYHEEAYMEGVSTCAAIKDAEIANLVNAEAEAMALVLNHEGHIEKLNAEIAEHRELWKDLRNVLEQTQKSLAAAEKEIASRDLMIKELREALHNIHCNWDEMYPEDIDKVITEALAKSEHHNSRALEKMLLEAELKGLKFAYEATYPYSADSELLVNRIAELNNKE